MSSKNIKELKPIPLGKLSANPLVSVLMVNYNYAEFIGEAIESVLDQTYKNWELIICDDGSTDNSLEIIEKFQEKNPRIKLIKKENGGQASALNAAYELSMGEIICLLDSDDYFEMSKVEKVVNDFLNNSDCGVHFHSMMRIDSTGKNEGRYPLVSEIPNGWLGDDVIKLSGGFLNISPTSGISFRQEDAEKIFPIYTSISSNADAFIIAISLLLSPVVSNKRILAYYRLHNRNLSNVLKEKRSLNELIKKKEKELSTVLMIYNSINKWLKEHFFVIRLYNIENNWFYVEEKYVINKLKNNLSLSRFWYKKLLCHPLTKSSKHIYYFYKISIFIYPSFLKHLLEVKYGQSKYKFYIQKFVEAAKPNE